MGVAASKTSAASAARSRVIRTNVSLEQLVALSRGAASELPAPAQATAVETSSTPVDAHGSKVELLEMRQHLLHDMQHMEDLDRVKFLEESTRAFEATASSHRPRSTQPVRLPTDKTSVASSTGVGGVDEEQVRGRLTARDLRTLLRLHYEKPESWTPEVLADKYGLEAAAMRCILSSVGPPNVLPPRGSSEHPLGVWFGAPGSLPAQPKQQQQQQTLA
ncbi:NADH dehydrogenase [ubiquinone] 1 alpha subcomplex assembly factor 4 [Phytophthora cinnamomi]|uniref:NADH dehydrogenase [ubiquinone] 1 alpha subcomplex assembly factor 4 n=1 Tax=Phytophthora cinnamomi TaxID=4785 RepID=UPI003559EBB0|nr:NADH dehydrogenase [ubiquinone] 1 alpha subcomplex assembly factor 4 [Phytophthora cinnamomi]